MHPAYSVIFFTTASGAGYGLLALAALAAMSHGRASSPEFALACLALALGLITSGLLSSTAHLGRPERSWRAFSQWRSSWLSREGVAAVLTYPVALAFGAVWSGLLDMPQLLAPLALATVFMCAVTVFCTGMIYAQLKTIPAWHNRFTVLGYLLFGLATGAVLLSFLSLWFGRFQSGAGAFQSILAAGLLLAALILKALYWHWLDGGRRRISMSEATGLGAGVRQWETPHTASNFIMKEMGYAVGRAHARLLRSAVMVLLAAAILLMLAAMSVSWLGYAAVPLALLAAWTERWLFFAEAEHVVGLFYGKARV
jgi:DMSO reductase anchor subunit